MTTKTDYEIGYGRPPKHARWKKGQSGNPGGPRKRPEGLGPLVAALLAQPVVVRRGKTTKRMTRLEQLLHRLLEKAIAGDPRLMKMALDEVRRDEARAPEAVPTDLDAADAEVLAALFARLTGNAARPGEREPDEAAP